MKAEKEKSKQNTSDAPEKRSTVRWNWVLIGALLSVGGLSLPFAVTYYYSHFGNRSGTGDVKIPSAPSERERIGGIGKKKKSFFDVQPILPSRNPFSENNNEFSSPRFEKAVYRYSSDPVFTLAAFQSTANVAPTVKPSPTITPRPAKSQNDEKDRNFFEKIFGWFVRLFRKKRVPNQPSRITSLTLSSNTIFLSCPVDTEPVGSACLGETKIRVAATAVSPTNESLIYRYTVSGGRVVGSGSNVIWDLSEAARGTYTITAAVDDGRAVTGETFTRSATVSECNDCGQFSTCPALHVSASNSSVTQGEPITFVANISGGNRSSFTYNWSVSSGTIISGQGTTAITVDTPGLGGQNITSTVKIGGLASDCQSTSSETVFVKPPPYSPAGDIRGRVVYSNKPLSNVRVVLKNIEGVIIDATVTDADGNYAFLGIGLGDYRIEAELPMGSLINRPVSLRKNGQTVTADISFGGVSPTPTPIQSPTPTPAQSPTPNQSPTPGVSPTVIPTPSPTVDANVSVNTNSAGNSNSAINSNQKITESFDQAAFDYPVYFIRDTDHKVNLKLDFVEGKPIVTATQTNVNGVTTNSAVIPIVIPGPPSPKYEIYVNAALEPIENLDAPKTLKGGWQKYIKQFNQPVTPNWTWEIKTKQSARDSEKVRLRLSLDYGFKLKSDGDDQIPDNTANAWRSNVLEGQVGLPLLVWLFSYLSVPGGVMLSFLGFFKGKQTAGVSVLTETSADEVQCTLYAPSEAKTGGTFIVQVFAHLLEQAESLAEIARMTDENLRRQTAGKLDKLIERGSSLTFHLLMSDVEIDEPAQKHVWRGNVVEVPFVVKIPSDHEIGLKHGKVIVSENDIPIGRLIFKVNIIGNLQPLAASVKPLTEENLARFQQAFISYASEDRPEVLKRVQQLHLTRIKYFQDVLDLEPGELWEKGLYTYIDQSDVIFLYWSKAASKSVWVEKEILYALERQHGDECAPPEIIPVIIEGPPPVKPPDALNFLHFNDKFIYFIYAAEAEHEIKHQND